MTGVIVVAVFALFLGGVVIGALAAAAVAIRREDRSYQGLAGEEPRPLVKYARYLTGLARAGLDGEFVPPHGNPRRY